MCAIFEFWWNNFLMGIKFNFKFESWEKFYKGFPCKKKITWKFLVKWTKIKIQWDSFVKFSVGGSRSIYRGITYKIEEEKIYKGFPFKSFLLEVPDQFLGEFHIKLKRKNFTKDFLVKNNIGHICLNNFFMGMKFDFKFEISEIFYKGFPCKKKYGNPCFSSK